MMKVDDEVTKMFKSLPMIVQLRSTMWAIKTFGKKRKSRYSRRELFSYKVYRKSVNRQTYIKWRKK